MRMWTREELYELIVQGRTEALDFIGILIEQYRDLAEEYEMRGGPCGEFQADAYTECADMLETKMEDYANEK